MSEYSDYPEAAKRLPRVASSGAVDLEGVLALKPDLVVAWRLEATAAALARLEALGLPVFYSEPRRLAQIPDSIEALGELAGTARTRALSPLRCARSLSDRSQYRSRARTVFYQISERPLMTLGGRQFVSDAIELCGGRNVFADSAVDGAAGEHRSRARRRPRSHRHRRPGPSDRSWQAFWRRFPGLRAVQSGNLYAVPMNEMHRHGPRAIGATAVLAAHRRGEPQGCQPAVRNRPRPAVLKP